MEEARRRSEHMGAGCCWQREQQVDGHEATQCLRPGTAGGWARSQLSLPGGRPESLFAVWSPFISEFVDDFFSSFPPLLFLPFPSFFASFSSLFSEESSGCKGKKVSARHHAFSIEACGIPPVCVKSKQGDTISGGQGPGFRT